MQKLLLLLLCSILLAANISAKTIRYVKIDGTGDGSSWSNASNNIQTMIDNSSSGDEVWVAKGTYFPTTETIARDSRSRTFLISSGVNIRGGFSGVETAINQRIIIDLNNDGRVDSCEMQNKTILSGDIDGVEDKWTKSFNNDSTWYWSIKGNENNCYTVVTASSASSGMQIIDGFSVIGGNANSNLNGKGGGIYSKSEDYTIFSRIQNCIVSNCYAYFSGGGIYSISTFSDNCKVSNCRVFDCATAYDGGGIYSINAENCIIDSCSAASGGGVESYNISNCIISNCSAKSGGGISSWGTTSKCIVKLCTAISGGGIKFSNSQLSKVANCTISSCYASSNGGGVYSMYDTNNPSTSRLNITNCNLFDCKSKQYGGGVYYSTSPSTINYMSNCLVTNCSANSGGGIYSESYSGSNKTNITNCTITNCSATDGGGIYSKFSNISNCLIANCLSSNSGGAILSSSSLINNCGATNNKTNNSIGSGISGVTSGVISPDITKTLIQATDFIGTALTNLQKDAIISANWHLAEGSACINAGTSSSILSEILSSSDIDNNSRVLYGTIDIGAYEYIMPTVNILIKEDLNTITDWNNSGLFYNSSQINGGQNIKWVISNQKADFTWQTNLTMTYSEPIFTYQVNASTSTKVFLRYDMYFQAYAGSISPLGTEKLNVEYSTDLVTWSTIATYSNANGTIANQTYKHDLSSLLAGKQFFIRFNANGANSNRIEKWEIDNIIIDADGLSDVNLIQQNKYKYHVINSNLYLDNLEENAKVKIINANGKIISDKFESKSASYYLPTHGIYIIKVVAGNYTETKKIVF